MEVWKVWYSPGIVLCTGFCLGASAAFSVVFLEHNTPKSFYNVLNRCIEENELLISIEQ